MVGGWYKFSETRRGREVIIMVVMGGISEDWEGKDSCRNDNGGGGRL